MPVSAWEARCRRDEAGGERAVIDNEIGLQLGDRRAVGGAVAHQHADLRQLARRRRQEGAAGRAGLARPAQHLLRRQRIDEDRRRLADREDARHRIADVDPAPGGVGDTARRRRHRHPQLLRRDKGQCPM
jgi:hypothetical protein